MNNTNKLDPSLKRLLERLPDEVCDILLWTLLIVSEVVGLYLYYLICKIIYRYIT
jgi:hypothetical protein